MQLAINQDWHRFKDVKEDTIEECSKFGKVLNCKVDKESKSGMVYLEFSNEEEAKVAAEKMHGRWFAKRRIISKYVPGM